MFIGHFALGFAATRFAPRLPLAAGFVACQFLDLLWPVLVLTGVESVHVDPRATQFTPLAFYYPWSHSLLLTAVYAAIGFVGARVAGLGSRSAVVASVLVLSHWFLDFASHGPDMPLAPWGSTKLGLGLWNSLTLTLLSELSLFALGVWWYARATSPIDRQGIWALWTLVAFFALMYLASAFGPKPTPGMSAESIAEPALATWLFVVWAYWVDRHRKPRS
jgi:hypothetical protein